jgi:hypothetical protein
LQKEKRRNELPHKNQKVGESEKAISKLLKKTKLKKQIKQTISAAYRDSTKK